VQQAAKKDGRRPVTREAPTRLDTAVRTSNLRHITASHRMSKTRHFTDKMCFFLNFSYLNLSRVVRRFLIKKTDNLHTNVTLRHVRATKAIVEKQ